MTDSLRVERDGRVAILTLNRPEKLNSLSIELRAALARTLSELEADDGVGAVVLTGAGERAFCAGMDIKEVGLPNPSGEPLVDPYTTVEVFKKPVIAAVNGLCLTGGLELILVCDVVVASRNARFADTHVRVGLVPGRSGITQRLAHQIGIQRAKEIQLTGNYVDAQRAFDIGLINRVVEPEELMPTALGLAHDMADGDFACVMAYKQSIDDGFQLSFGEGVALGTQRSLEYAAGVDHDELVRAKEATIQRGRKQTVT